MENINKLKQLSSKNSDSKKSRTFIKNKEASFTHVHISVVNSLKDENEKEKIPLFKYEGIKMLEMLGEGGFGKVFRAYNIDKNQFLALKYSKKDPTLDDVNKIQKEHYILKEVEKINKNQNFLKYEGIFRNKLEENNYFLSMESGEINLLEILKVRKQYSLNNVIYIFNSLANDLLLLEKNGIATRDVKTENVILVYDEKNPNLFKYKVSDFGIGCYLQKNQKKINCVELSGWTRKYSSPEIKKIILNHYPETTYNPFISDVYSLALVVIELLGYKKSNFRLQIDHPLYPLLREMLELDPDQRKDFEGVVEDLKLFLSQAEQPENEAEYIKEFLKINKFQLAPPDKINNLIDQYKSYREISHYKKADEILSLCNDIYQESYEQIKNTLSELKILRENAISSKEFKGNYKEAIKWEEKYKKHSISLYGEISEKVVDAENLIAFSLLKLGYYEKAEKLYLNALKIKESLLNTENPENETLSADILENLAIFYKDIKQSEQKSEECFSKALDIKIKTLGKDHPDTAKCYINFATFVCDLKKDYEKGENLYLKALEINEKKLGMQHIQTGYSYINLALFYSYCKKHISDNTYFKDVEKDWLTAYQYFSKALIISQNNFGNQSLDMANLYESIGDYHGYTSSVEDRDTKKNKTSEAKKCEDFLLKSLNLKEKNLGQTDIQIAHINYKIGICYEIIFWAEAESKTFFKKSLDIYETLLGNNHILTKKAKNAFLKGVRYDRRMFIIRDYNRTIVVDDYKHNLTL